MIGVSIIICCYNSATRLPKTLEHLARQVVPSTLPWEIILIDNNCSDDTVNVAKNEWCKYNLEIKLKTVNQPIAGLSYARYLGVEESKFDYVIFCDDDNWLQSDYIRMAFEILNKHKTVSAVGCKIKAVADIDFPNWWFEFSEHFAVGNQLPKTGLANQRKYLWGAGLILRKHDYLFVCKEESLLQDRKGVELSSGGDSEICARLLLYKKNIYYSDELVLKHYIANERLTEVYLTKLLKGHRESFKVLEKYWKIIEFDNMSLENKIKKTFYRILYFQIFKRKFITELFLLWNIQILIDNEYKAILKIKKKISSFKKISSI